MPTLDNYSIGNYGLSGDNVKYASGIISSAVSTLIFDTLPAGTTSLPYLQVFGLKFRPKKIIIRLASETGLTPSMMGNYDSDTLKTEPGNGGYNIFLSVRGSAYLIKVFEFFTDDQVAASGYVTNTSFRLPALNTNQSHFWEAWG